MAVTILEGGPLRRIAHTRRQRRLAPAGASAARRIDARCCRALSGSWSPSTSR